MLLKGHSSLITTNPLASMASYQAWKNPKVLIMTDKGPHEPDGSWTSPLILLPLVTVLQLWWTLAVPLCQAPSHPGVYVLAVLVKMILNEMKDPLPHEHLKNNNNNKNAFFLGDKHRI